MLFLPYLVFSSFLLGLALAAVAATRQRRLLLWSGVIALPNALLEIAFIPGYWRPTLAFGGPLGFEDFVFSFSAGVLASSLALAPLRYRVRLGAAMRVAVVRWLVIEVMFLLLFGLFLIADLPVMGAALLGMCGVAVFLERRSRPLVRLAIFGGLGFTFLYVSALAGAFAVWPEWSEAWADSGVLGRRLLGIAVGEVAWAAGFGAVHAWAVGYVLDLRIVGARPLTARAS